MFYLISIHSAKKIEIMVTINEMNEEELIHMHTHTHTHHHQFSFTTTINRSKVYMCWLVFLKKKRETSSCTHHNQTERYNIIYIDS